MKVMFLEAPFTGKVSLCNETINYLKKYQKIGLFSSVQFVDNLDRVKEQLKELGIEIVMTKLARTSREGQLLGCNVYDDLPKVDAFLYIGDGKFHPLALVYCQEKDVICDNPIEGKMIVLERSHIERKLKRRKGSLLKFKTSKKIGVIVTLKPGQEQLKKSFSLEEKYPDKEFYYFIDNNISFDQLENFPFVDVWVNSACPRIGLDDQEMFRKGVVNLMDVLGK